MRGAALLPTLLLAGALAWLSAAHSQDFSVAFGGRINTCVGIEGFSVDFTGLCNVTAFVTVAPVPVAGGLTTFVQVSPRYGPFYENWRVRVGIPKVRFNFLGLTLWHEPSVSTGLELGEWFIRVEEVIEFSFHWEVE